eukprot:433873_1
MTMMLLQGYNGNLNLCISMNNMKDSELNLLKQIKMYIEKDMYSPSHKLCIITAMGNKVHRYLDEIESCCQQLLLINPNKCEYHHLYARTLWVRCKSPYSGNEIVQHNEMNSLSEKHDAIAFDLDNYHPLHLMRLGTTYSKFVASYGLDGIYGITQLLSQNMSNWCQQMEFNLKDIDFRKKYHSIIDELECKFATYFSCFISPYIPHKNRQTAYNQINKYFIQYCDILKSSNFKINLCSNYLFKRQHLNYCANFAHQFRLFGKFNKALSALTNFIQYFDSNYDILTESAILDWDYVLLIIDTMLCAGKVEVADVFITELIEKTNDAILVLNLMPFLCKLYAQNKSFEADVNRMAMYCNIAKKDYDMIHSSMHYYMDVCLLYFRICKEQYTSLEKVNKYIHRIINIINQQFSINDSKSFFGESCFMLAFMYRKYLHNVDGASFLYYLSILYTVDLRISHSCLLSYFNLANCLYKSKQYQLSSNLFKRIYGVLS